MKTGANRGLSRNRRIRAQQQRHKEQAAATPQVPGWVKPLSKPGNKIPSKTSASVPTPAEQLTKLIESKNGDLTQGEVRVEVAQLARDAAKSFTSLDAALTPKKKSQRLKGTESAEAVTSAQVALLAENKLAARDVRQLHKVALTEVYRLFNEPGVDDAFHIQAGRELTRIHGLSSKELEQAESRPTLSPFEEDRRRSNALLALLHSARGEVKELKLSDSAEAYYVARLGESGGPSALPLLNALAAKGRPATASAAKGAIAQVQRAAKMTIVSVSMETPFLTVGGLSNVMGAEPQALRALGHQTLVITPRHGNIDAAKHQLVDSGLGQFTLETTDGPRSFRLLKTERGGVPYYFIDDFVDAPRQPLFSNRQGVYSDSHGEYGDNPQRLEFLARAAVIAQKAILKGKAPDIIQANDSHTGFVPYYVKQAGLTKTATAMVVHNLAFQSTFPKEQRSQLMLGRDPKNDALFGPGGDLEFYGQINSMKAGLTQADGVFTVSEKYRDETLTLADKGAGLGGVLAVKAMHDKYFGRMNGVDLSKWDPSTDPALPNPYSPSDLSGKAANKSALLKKYGLKEEPGVALHASVGRLDAHQKGYDDLLRVIEHSMTVGPKAKFILMGSGDPALMARSAALAKKYPNDVAYDPKYSPEVEHQIIAGSDFLQMLSRFEPGGQPNIYALAMGTIPLVRATGGLDQAIASFDAATATGNGFKFTGTDPLPMFREATALFAKGPEAMNPLIQNAFASAKQFTWERSAEQTAAIFRRLLKPQD